nr:acyltransferase [Microbacterium endophyticum]
MTIGNDVYIGRNSTIEVDGSIGDHVLIANNVGVIGRKDHDIYEVGSTVRQAAGVRDAPTRLSLTLTIGSDCWIGFGAVLLSGVSIGDHSIVAAGSVVRDDIPPNSIAAGNPAQVIKSRFSDEALVAHRTELMRSGVRLHGS